MSRCNPALWACALVLAASAASAQPAYPGRPIHLIVPTPAGGPSDAVARVLAKGLSASLGQEVLVENRPGASTGIGAGVALQALPDGYTLFFALASSAGLPHLSRASPYKSLAEFTPIAALGGNTQCLVVPASLAAGTLADLAARAKSSAQPLMRGSSNVSEDMVAGQITGSLGFRLERVPYKGAPEMMPDLLEGRIQAAVLPVGASLPHVRAGRLVLLGCSVAQRLPQVPTVPTLAEAGVAGAPLISAHFLLGPPRLPAPLVERLAAAVAQTAAGADFKREMERLLVDGTVRSPAETRELIARAEAQYVRFVRETGASID